MPYRMIQLSINISSTGGAVVSISGMARFNLVYRSDITTTYWLLSSVFGSGSIMSISTNSNGPLAGKSFN